ncbi:MAG TPA: ribonuclease HII [Candidatus Saccharimonadales bacterium]|nr:ribonuclease HII [Candidatus Saccharimonadales bacterium]
MIVIPDISLEQSLWQQGFMHVAGVDEAGKGPWAGPVTAGAVMIHEAKQIVKTVRDSKIMTEKQREKAFDEICKKSTAFGVGIVSAEEIDAIGIDPAVKKAMLMALEAIEVTGKIKLNYVIVDGSKTKLLEKYPSKRILKGGLYHYTISAGSVLAKVTRDRLMKKFADQYPAYGFEKHVGYGTAIHMQALREHGPCPLHRKSFAPIRKLL